MFLPVPALFVIAINEWFFNYLKDQNSISSTQLSNWHEKSTYYGTNLLAQFPTIYSTVVIIMWVVFKFLIKSDVIFWMRAKGMIAWASLAFGLFLSFAAIMSFGPAEFECNTG